MTNIKATHVIVEGRVQGVWFRDSTRRQALTFNLTGWVRNLPDGSVEAMLYGAEADVSSMLEWLKEGSPQSRVDRLQIKERASSEQLDSFEIRI